MTSTTPAHPVPGHTDKAASNAVTVIDGIGLAALLVIAAVAGALLVPMTETALAWCGAQAAEFVANLRMLAAAPAAG